MDSMTARLLLCLALCNVLGLHAVKDITILRGIDKVMLDAYIQHTDSMTKPAIIKNFFDPALFEEVCSCNKNTSFFDDLYLPWQRSGGNPRFEMHRSQVEGTDIEFERVNAGEFFREYACAPGNNYVFYDVFNGGIFSRKMRHFFEQKVNPRLNIAERITDPSYYRWFNEIFIGHSDEEFPTPSANKTGSAPHRAPVLNFYFQMCGRKEWFVGGMDADFGENDKSMAILKAEEMKEFQTNEKVYHGYTEPGDVLLNPPWLWHYVKAGAGFNFAVTHKQVGFGWWSMVNGLDPFKVGYNLKTGASDLATQRVPDRDMSVVNKIYNSGLPKGAFVVDMADLAVPWAFFDESFNAFKPKLHILYIGFALGVSFSLCFVCCAKMCCRCFGRKQKLS